MDELPIGISVCLIIRSDKAIDMATGTAGSQAKASFLEETSDD